MHYYAIFMHSACVHVQMYIHTYALCGYTCHLRTRRYAAIQVNRPSDISQAVAVNRTQQSAPIVTPYPRVKQLSVWTNEICEVFVFSYWKQKVKFLNIWGTWGNVGICLGTMISENIFLNGIECAREGFVHNVSLGITSGLGWVGWVMILWTIPSGTKLRINRPPHSTVDIRSLIWIHILYM